jgi:FkbM family methyltransferase
MKLGKALTAALYPRYWKALSAAVVPTIEHGPGLAGVSPATVIDVGANKGQFTAFARARWPRARFFAFEPLPGPSRRFRAIFGDRVPLYNLALGREDATLEIHIASREDSSSLLPIGRLQVEEFHTAEVATLSVPVRRLDGVLGDGSVVAPALLKIDVQGFEHEVLEGCTGIADLIEWIYVEASFVELYQGQKLYGEVERLLASMGYDPVREHNVQLGKSGSKIQADILFARRGRS